MREIPILLVSLLAAFAQGTNTSLFSNRQSSWIIGGKNAGPIEFPYMVSIRGVIGNPPICGGSIISHSYMMTAAHCVFRKSPSAFVLVVGTNLLDGPGERYTISRFIVHERFDPKLLDHDIALIKPTKPIKYVPAVQPVGLPDQDEVTAIGTECILTGWGNYRLHKAVEVSNILQLVRLRIIPLAECRKYYPFTAHWEICAFSGSFKGPSVGDSGGPLVCRGKQIGILEGAGSKRLSISRTPVPSTYLEVSKYVNWIRQNAV